MVLLSLVLNTDYFVKVLTSLQSSEGLHVCSNASDRKIYMLVSTI